ncbi:MAG: type III-B CRISPR module RAMP protein Cmr1 [Lewinellaceae bacterium]|nr:type III-B CRISPR module RAMP protein Cmr1 [Lewinellaceae bacterium]
METITFTCKVITPMFLAGADGKTPELRAPSIKGAMRFWWRACNGHLPLGDMKRKEQELFGGVGNGGAKRSKVTVQVNPIELKIGQLPGNGKDQNPGLYYLWYSIPMNDNRPAIWEGKFSIILSSFDNSAILEAAMTFWLLANLGGVGTRSRRGAGNFQVEQVTSTTISKNELRFVPEDKEPIKSFLEEGLNKIAHKFNFERRFDENSQTEFPMLCNAQVAVIDFKRQSPLTALEKLGQVYQDFRDRKRPDYDEVKNFIQSGERPAQIKRVEFGLPLSFRFGSLSQGNRSKSPRAEIVATSKIDRSASSLHFRVTGNGETYHPLIVNFSSKLLPERVELEIKTPRNNFGYTQSSAKWNQTYQGIKEEFLSTLPIVTI